MVRGIHQRSALGLSTPKRRLFLSKTTGFLSLIQQIFVFNAVFYNNDTPMVGYLLETSRVKSS